MKFRKKYFRLSFFVLSSIALMFAAPLVAQDARFTVVLDAGHGGHDPGAIGAISREKDINLDVTLNLGEIIEQKYKDVKVVYTRKTDKYLTLQERADVVNNNHADLFICVHTNSSQSASAFGAESFTLGLAKTKGNLDVAMRENSVITLEENYKTKYQGFDPHSVDSYIMFEFMQDKYIDRSVDFASTIQKQFRNFCNRSDRGVRQAGFWVLHRSACPSVLVELGFISNPAEERYLSSALGQKEMASAIFNAFIDYKKNHDKKSGRQTAAVAKFYQPEKVQESQEDKVSSKVKADSQDTIQLHTKSISQVSVKTQVAISDTSSKTGVNNKRNENESVLLNKSTDQEKKMISSRLPVFKVQLLASAKKLQTNSADFKGVSNIESFAEGGLIKYTVGSETEYSKIEKIRLEVLSKFPEAFIIAFVGEQKIAAKAALKLVK